MTTAQARALALPPDVLATARELTAVYPPEYITRTLAELCVERNVRALSEDDVRACFSAASPELMPTLPPLPEEAIQAVSDAFHHSDVRFELETIGWSDCRHHTGSCR